MINLLNNFSTTLAAAITDTQTTINVAHGLPALASDDNYLLTLFEKAGAQELNWEIVKVTSSGSVGGSTLTVVRGQEGTTPLAWASGTKVEMRLTAGSIAEIQKMTEKASANAVAMSIVLGG
jgi:hypothetical protein